MMVAPRFPPGSTVLVTGATGLIGGATVDQLLQRGYDVVGTTRDPSKGTELLSKFDAAYGKGRFRLLAINDFTDVDQFKPALKGVSGVLHIATDASFSSDPNIVVTNTVNSVLAVLKAAAKTPSVKSVVLTSSRGVIFFPQAGQTIVADLKGYDEEAVRKAWSPEEDPQKAVWCYLASKIQGEQAAWKFVKEGKPHFAFNTILPDTTLGRIVNPRPGVYSTASWLTDFLQTSSGMILNFATVPSYYVSVADVARLHVLALLEADVEGERLWAAAEPFTLNNILKIWREEWPEKKARMPKDVEVPEPPKIQLDNSRSLELLKRDGRLGWDPLRATVIENVRDAIGSL